MGIDEDWGLAYAKSQMAAAPALPLADRTHREPDGSSGNLSLGILAAVSVGAAVAFSFTRGAAMPTDEMIVSAMSVGGGVAFFLAVLNRVLRLKLLSQMAERVTFVLIPPLALIFLVLGTIFLGIATPTEGGAMGASGALIMAVARRRLSWSLMRQAMESTARLTTFVVFILIGARVFSLTFYGVDGHLWVEHLLTDLPGGQIGFLIVVNILVFVLAFFLDFFELSFIVVPLLGPVAEKLGIDLIWFGILLAINMQTSFMHPPFGFALFYLRSVAPQAVKTTEIYWGAVPFVVIQMIMVAIVIFFPGIVQYDKSTMASDAVIDLAPSGDQDAPALPPAAPPAPAVAPPADAGLAPAPPPAAEPTAPNPADQGAAPAQPDLSELLNAARESGKGEGAKP
jgi:TRAP-type mannitol/chloroaromatic compound transport system permease large subunit